MGDDCCLLTLMCCNLLLFRMLVVYVHPVSAQLDRGRHTWAAVTVGHGCPWGVENEHRRCLWGDVSPSSLELAYMSTCCQEVQQQQRTHGQDKLSVLLLNIHLFLLMSLIPLQLDAADDVTEGPLHWHEQHVLI